MGDTKRFDVIKAGGIAVFRLPPLLIETFEAAFVMDVGVGIDR